MLKSGKFSIGGVWSGGIINILIVFKSPHGLSEKCIGHRGLKQWKYLEVIGVEHFD